MILADTSVWVDHLRQPDKTFATLLMAYKIAGHPLVTAEIAMGSLGQRAQTLAGLDELPEAPIVDVTDVREFVERNRIYSRGIGLIDASLVVSCLLRPGLRLWTRDRRLHAIAGEFGVVYQHLH